MTPMRVSLNGAGLRLVADWWDPAPDTAGQGIVLLLHGGAQTRHCWANTGPRLAANGWAAIAVDARGHGDSDWDSEGNYGMQAMVADLRALVAGLPEPVVLVGASMGGMTALLALAEDPALARALVLVDVTPSVEPEGQAEIMNFVRGGLGGFASLEEALDAVMAYNPNRTRAPRREGLRKNLRWSAGRWYWHWDPRVLDNRETEAERWAERGRAAARGVTVPALLVRGKQSRIVTEAGMRELLELMPSARWIDVSGAGHMVAGDDNDVFCGGLLEFLASAVSDRPSGAAR